MRQSLFTFWFFFAFTVSQSTWAGPYDPSVQWRVLESAHFTLVYNETQKELATNYLRNAEQAHATLEPVFHEMPSERTVIVIADNTDQANGFATFLPSPQIVVYPVLPTSLDSISYYESWGYELLIHEYTHILTFAPAHGFYTPFKYIFGTVVRPTAILPRWYLEGLAVEIESRFTTHGRLRAPATSAALRALASDDRLANETLDRINESSITTWPFGQRPYLFGSLLIHELANQKGLELLPELDQRYARRVPFLLDTPLHEAMGATFDSIWSKLNHSYSVMGKLQIQAIEKAGQENLLAFTHSGDSQFSPVISPDGTLLAYVAFESYVGPEIRLARREPGDKHSFSELPFEHVQAGRGTLRLAWLPDSRSFVFDRLATHKRYFTYRDLYHYNVDTKKTTQLTFGARAMEPTVSPDGKFVVYVNYDGSAQALNIMELSTLQSRTLFKAPFELRISRPEFIDEKNVVFVGRNRQGFDRFYIYNTKTDVRTPILSQFRNVGMPRMTKRGLLFISPDTGVANLYLATFDLKSARAITNATTEVVNGDFDSVAVEIISSRLTSTGRKLFATTQPHFMSPPVVQPIPNQDFGPAAPRVVTADTTVTEKSYWPIRYMLPRYWIPFVYPVDKGILFQGSTANSDPVGRHAYQIEGSYDTVTEKSGYGLRYVNSSTPVDLSTSYAESTELVSTGSATLTHRTFSLGGTFYLPGLNNNWRANLGGLRLMTDIPSTTSTRRIERLGPTLQVQFNNTGEPDRQDESNNGLFWSLNHTSFLHQGQYLSYDRDSLNMGFDLRSFLPKRHRLVGNFKSSFAPQLAISNVVALGDRTIGANYLVSLINSPYLLRGYPSGAVVGRKILNANLEYHLPVADLFRGWGLTPLFLRSLETSFFIDGAAVDGAYFDPARPAFVRSELDRAFWGAGAELKLTATAAYHLPLTFTLGLYYGFDREAGGGFAPFAGIGYSGHGGVDDIESSMKTQFRPNSFAR